MARIRSRPRTLTGIADTEFRQTEIPPVVLAAITTSEREAVEKLKRAARYARQILSRLRVTPDQKPVIADAIMDITAALENMGEQ